MYFIYCCSNPNLYPILHFYSPLQCIAEEPPELPELNTPSIEKLVSRTDNAADENSDTGKEVEPRKQAKAIRDAKFNTLKLPSAVCVADQIFLYCF